MQLDGPNAKPEGAEPCREADGVWMSQLTFEIYLDDSRYAVPTLKLVAATDHADAFKIARLMLDESAHHRGVEVWQDGRRLVGFGSLEAGRSAGA